MKEYVEGIMAYLTAAMAYFIANADEVGSILMGGGSAVLLLARLLVDVPKAIETIKSWRAK